MTGPIFHRVFLSVCPDTRLLESSSRFTSSAPRPGLSTSSSHIYKYQPAKWHFLSTHPLLGKNRELCDLAHRLTVLRHETSWGLAPPHPTPASPSREQLAKKIDPSATAFKFQSGLSLIEKASIGLYKIV